MSAGQFLDRRTRDPAFKARQERFAAEEANNRRDYQRAAEPVLSELAALGYNIAAIGDLRSAKVKYDTAVPVLVRWLPRVDDRYVKEDIVRTLSVPWAKAALPTLIEQYRTVEDESGLGLRWAIGNALEVLADDTVFDDVVSLARDRRYGRAREMVVAALGNMRDSRAVALLLELITDDSVAGFAAMGLGKLRAREGRSAVAQLLEHPKPWVRQEAAKALKRIDAKSGNRGESPAGL